MRATARRGPLHARHCLALPIDDPDGFFTRLGQVSDAVVLDHFVVGDGTPDGRRTAKTALPASMAKVNPASATLAYRDSMAEIARGHMLGRVGISAGGFAYVYE